jgi:hypothetical protein
MSLSFSASEYVLLNSQSYFYYRNESVKRKNEAGEFIDGGAAGKQP